MKNNKTIDLKNYTVPAGKVLVMKQVSPKNTAYNGFEWPDLGFVECEKWEAKEECGNGLHGFLKGAGNGSLADYDKDAIWKLCEVEENGIIDLKGKVKFKNAEVIFSGCLKDVADIMSKLYPNTCVIGCTATAGDSGTATAGDSGTATAGDSGTATAGDRGTATAGDSGTATAGNSGTATAGNSGTATAGNRGTATAGNRGTATAGYSGTATAGDRGTATAGDSGTATAGDSGTATAGDSGVLIITYYDNAKSQYLRKVALVGYNGILHNVKYRINDNYEFEKVS